MPRPRVAHVINSIGLGGVPEAAYHLMRTLAFDCEPRLLVLRPLPEMAEAERIARKERFEDLGVRVSFAPPATRKIADIGLLADWIEAQGVDILHTHSYRPNLFARLAGSIARSGGPKLVAHYHNDYDANWQRDGTLPLDRHLARVTDQLIACSGAVRGHVAERLAVAPDRILTVSNGVEIDRFSDTVDRVQARLTLGLPQDGHIVGLVGRLSRQKGQDTLLQAAARLKGERSNLTFALAGAADSPEEHDQLARLANRLGVSSDVRFLGFVQDMAALYSAVDVLAAPSRWEGFGLMLVEAMAAGTPIVASRVGAIPEVVGDAGAAILVDTEDAEGLAWALARILDDRGMADRMSTAGRERAHRFSWDRSGSALGQVYTDLILERGA